MPGSKTFHSQGEKLNALAVASLPRLVKLSAVGFTKSVTSSSSGAMDLSCLERVDNRHIKGGIPAS